MPEFDWVAGVCCAISYLVGQFVAEKRAERRLKAACEQVLRELKRGLRGV